MGYSNGSQSVVPGLAASVLPGNLLQCKFSGPTLDRLNQKFEGWGPAVCFNKASRGFWCHSSVTTTGLKWMGSQGRKRGLLPHVERNVFWYKHAPTPLYLLKLGLSSMRIYTCSPSDHYIHIYIYIWYIKGLHFTIGNPPTPDLSMFYHYHP